MAGSLATATWAPPTLDRSAVVLSRRAPAAAELAPAIPHASTEPAPPIPRASTSEVLRAVIVAIGETLLAGLLWALIWAIIPQLAGWTPVVITGTSMHPALERGDVVLVRPTSAANLTPGAVITFDDPTDPGGRITHRIITVDDDGMIHTRGDANGSTDPIALRPEQVVGRGVLRIPRIGLPVIWIREGAWWELGITVTGLVAAIALVLTDIRERA